MEMQEKSGVSSMYIHFDPLICDYRDNLRGKIFLKTFNHLNLTGARSNSWGKKKERKKKSRLKIQVDTD